MAERHGFRVTERFSDAAISGGKRERPGYQALLSAARAKRFDVILAEDTSRLWRNLAEQWRAVAELLDAGVHLVTQDIDTRSENFKILLSVHGAMADVYRDQIAYRTKRGLEGRARKGKPTGGRAYGYIAARDAASGAREIHAEQADVVRRIFAWYADGKSPQWIAGELNRLGVLSPGASWNRTSQRLNAKRRRVWVATAIHGDVRHGTGILSNPLYTGELVWGRSTWKRSAADSKQRRWHVVDDAERVVRNRDERLRIVPQGLWDRVKARQRDISDATRTLRAAVKRHGRLPRYLLSGLLTCAACGGTIRVVNGREFGCATHRDGGPTARSNALRVRIDIAERKLIGDLVEEMLSPAAVALLEQQVRDHVREGSRAVQSLPTPAPADVVRKSAEIEQLKCLMKSGTLSPAVAQAAIDKAEEELQALRRRAPQREEKQTARIIRLLPQAADTLRERVRAGNAGLRDPRSIIQG